ncbi:low molecular weight phosphatase family protein [Mangrovimonas sp. TPBH4]|uniref:arsenate-mycothiol transferase ArsC n=1 Tax=Mangrovimonas sp. TPBH4 TaxID=1645914 RepID=UPI0006B66F53|nr:protein-tyrosine-phosphatase [Mangrovimonas sp. TPBH4]
MSLFKKLEEFIPTLDVNSISEERKETLQPLVDYIQKKVTDKNDIRINFICTHNSRRSHLSQVWAQTLAYHFGIKQVFCYSGGTEATALFPMAAQTLQNTGFEIATLSEGSNPVYSIKYAGNALPIIGFSKRMDDEFNPKSEFAAIMTCDSANEACPIVPGAEQRIPIMFEDPKAFDNTPQQAEKYSERSKQIATELFYVFSKIQTN